MRAQGGGRVWADARAWVAGRGDGGTHLGELPCFGRRIHLRTPAAIARSSAAASCGSSRAGASTVQPAAASTKLHEAGAALAAPIPPRCPQDPSLGQEAQGARSQAGLPCMPPAPCRPEKQPAVGRYCLPCAVLTAERELVRMHMCMPV